MTHILCIFDGFGLATKSDNNAIYLAKMPNFRSLLANSWWTTLDADGHMVGQESGLVGNSEVGHMNLGGLKLIPQLSYQITQSAKTNYKLNPEISPDQKIDPGEFLKKHSSANSNLHLITLFSQGKVHSDTRHLLASIKTGLENGFSKVYLHLFSDGRDSDRKSFWATWQDFQKQMLKNQIDISKVILSSIGGRFWGMDRDKNYDRIARGLSAILSKQTLTKIHNSLDNRDNLKKISNIFKSDSLEILTQKNTQDFDSIGDLENWFEEFYSQEIYDENIWPTSFNYPNQEFTGAGKSDIIWIQNFRADRVRQLTKALVNLNQELKQNWQIISNNEYAVEDISTTDYIQVFQNRPVQTPMAQVISEQNQSQLHIAETEKYNHVTYFLNGGQNKKFPAEEWKIIASNKVHSHAQKPAMKAQEVTDYILNQGLGKYDKIIVNYANPDMVAHTGDLHATIESLEILDVQLGRLMQSCIKNSHSLVLTADHGNAEVVGLIQSKNQTDTEHNSNPVPCILYNYNATNLIQDLQEFSQKFHIKNMDLALDNLQAKNQIDLKDQEKWLDNIPQPNLGLHWAGIIFMSLK